MRNLIIIITTALLFSCNTAKNDVHKYIMDSAPLVGTLDFIEVGKKDSMYTPHTQVASAILSTYIVMENSQYNAPPPRFSHHRGSYTVPDSIYILYDLIDSIQIATMTYLDFNGHLNNTPNSLGVEVKYRLNGTLMNNVFFYDADGKKISHTRNDIHESFKELVHLFTPMYKAEIYSK